MLPKFEVKSESFRPWNHMQQRRALRT